MMSLQEVKDAVDQLSPEEREELIAYLRMPRPRHPMLSPEERVQKLNEAFAQIREGLTDEQLKEMTEAMNEEYIEPWDEEESWKD